jgi:hypothetical protein
MTDLTVVSHSPSVRVIAAAELAEQRRNPRVIDGEVTGSRYPRPIWPALVSSAVMAGIAAASIVQEVAR